MERLRSSALKRDIMRTREIIEDALEEAIINNKVERAKDLINLIKHEENTREENQVGIALDSLNKEKQSFLHVAIEKRIKPIVEILFESQQFDPILFNKDINGRTVLFAAAENGYVDIFQRILAQAQNSLPDTPGYELWEEKDVNGDSIFHVATKHAQLGIISIFLSFLQENASEDPNYVFNQINRKNNTENTALHFEGMTHAHYFNIALVAKLINHGADILLFNQKKATPLEIILKQSLDKQYQLLLELNENKKTYFLRAYRLLAINSPIEYKQKYLDLLALYSLKEFLLAKLEFDDNIKKTSFQKIKEEQIELPMKLLVQLPFLLAMNQGINSDQSITENKDSLLAYQILDADLQKLNHYLQKIAEKIANLQGRADFLANNKFPFSRNELIGLIIALTIVYFCFTPVAVKYGSESMFPILRNHDNPLLPSVIFYILGSVLFGFGGFIITSIIFFVISDLIKDAQRHISNQEWQELIANIENNILQQLQSLENLDSGATLEYTENAVSLLPVTVQTIRDLEQNLADFAARNGVITEVIALFQRLETTLKQIRQEMIHTNKPFTLFGANAASQKGSRVEVNDEVVLNLLDSDDSSDELVFETQPFFQK